MRMEDQIGNGRPEEEEGEDGLPVLQRGGGWSVAVDWPGWGRLPDKVTSARGMARDARKPLADVLGEVGRF